MSEDPTNKEELIKANEERPLLKFSPEFKKQVLDEMTPRELKQFATAHGLIIGISNDNEPRNPAYLYLSDPTHGHQTLDQRSYFCKISGKKLSEAWGAFEALDQVKKFRQEVELRFKDALKSEYMLLSNIKKKIGELYIQALQTAPVISTDVLKKNYKDALRYWPQQVGLAKSGKMTQEEASYALQQLVSRRVGSSGQSTERMAAPNKQIEELGILFFEIDNLERYGPMVSMRASVKFVADHIFEEQHNEVEENLRKIEARWKEELNTYAEAIDNIKKRLDNLVPRSLSNNESKQLLAHPYRDSPLSDKSVHGKK